MAITFPRALPSAKFATHEFSIKPQDVTTPVLGGEIYSTQLAESRWRARYDVDAINDELIGVWEAWLDSLRNSGRTFFGRDARRPYPLADRVTKFVGATRHAGGAFDGTSSSWSVNSNRDVLTINTLPSAQKLAPGDMVSFRWSTTKRSLHRCLEAATAVNGVIAVTVEPIISARIVPNGAVVNLAKPDCVMVLIRQTPPSRQGKSTRISFEAEQRLEA